MSKNAPTTPTSPDSDISEVVPMSRTKRFVLIGVAIFCLVIFSATQPMIAVFANLSGDGPQSVATLDLPSGPSEITSEDYRGALRLMSWERNVLGISRSDDEEGVIAYATLRKLADELEVVITDNQVRDFIRFQMAVQRIADYGDLVKRFRFNSSLQYENLLRDLLRVQQVETLLGSAAIPTQDDVLAYWSDDFQEMSLDYVSWSAEDFSHAADALNPTDEELQIFFADGLDFTQRRALENEEAVAFEAIIVSADALQTAAVQAWASAEEPTEEQLQGFYDFRRFTLYRRLAPEEGASADAGLGPVLTREELGDRLAQDFRLHRAAMALIANADTEDLAAFSSERGVEYLAEATPVSASALESLPRIGTMELREMFRAEVGSWMDKAFLVGDVAFLVRPTESSARAMPPLEEIEESVKDYWREGQRGTLAREAAEAFVASLPQPEVEGDPVLMAQDAFGQEVTKVSGKVQALDWIARQPRPVVDPIWGDDSVRPWLRSTVGTVLEDYSDGEVLGPFEQGIGGLFVVARLVGTRDADATKIWPSEIEAAKNRAKQEAMTRFRTDQLSYEGLSRSYSIVQRQTDQ